MRKFLPMAIVGLIGVFLLALIISGFVMLGLGVTALVSKDHKSDPTQAKADPRHQGKQSLFAARSGFTTNVSQTDTPRGDQLVFAPFGAEIIEFPSSKKGTLKAYISQGHAKKKGHAENGELLPAIVFVHSGFAGIRPETWKEIDKFRINQDFVVMCPSFRGENGNPGRFEMFYGEVDDLLSAVSYLRSTNSVDPKRIYVVGVGSGGTLALLASVSGDPSSMSVRAYFAIGGIADLGEWLNDPRNHRKVDNERPPFNPEIPDETRLRSAAPFVRAIQQPTILFQLAANARQPSMDMRENAQQPPSVPFRVVSLVGEPKNWEATTAATLDHIHDQIIADRDFKRPFQFQPKLIKQQE